MWAIAIQIVWSSQKGGKSSLQIESKPEHPIERLIFRLTIRMGDVRSEKRAIGFSHKRLLSLAYHAVVNVSLDQPCQVI